MIVSVPRYLSFYTGMCNSTQYRRQDPTCRISIRHSPHRSVLKGNLVATGLTLYNVFYTVVMVGFLSDVHTAEESQESVLICTMLTGQIERVLGVTLFTLPGTAEGIDCDISTTAHLRRMQILN